MPTSVTIFVIAAASLMGIGLSGVFFCRHVLRKILAVNLAGSGVFLLYGALAHRSSALSPDAGSSDAVPHALVLTGIVVAVSATAVALVLYRRLATHESSPHSTEEHCS